LLLFVTALAIPKNHHGHFADILRHSAWI